MEALNLKNITMNIRQYIKNDGNGIYYRYNLYEGITGIDIKLQNPNDKSE